MKLRLKTMHNSDYENLSNLRKTVSNNILLKYLINRYLYI